MGFWFNVSKTVVGMVPYKVLISNYTRLKTTKLADVVDLVTYRKFFKCSKLVKNFETFIEKTNNFNKYCIINHGDWDYPELSYHFIRDMIALIIWCLENGYKPIIDFNTSSNKRNLWNDLYEQPYKVNVNDNIYDTATVCPLDEFVVVPRMFDVFDNTKVTFWHQICNQFLVYNKSSRDYILNEEKDVLNGKKVLGCLCRGQEYTVDKPKGHPVQPEYDELFAKVKEVFYQGEYEFIYLATEENRIAERFQKEFKDRVLFNNRHYVDVSYDETELVLRAEMLLGTTDTKQLKMLEYHSSMNILANCDSIVAGLCGGSEFAVYYNGNKYYNKYIFNKGKY